MNSGLTLSKLVNNILEVFNLLIPALVGVAIIIFFIGLIKYVYHAGDQRGHARGREILVWGLVAMFVLMSLWGIIEFAKNSIFP